MKSLKSNRIIAYLIFNRIKDKSKLVNIPQNDADSNVITTIRLLVNTSITTHTIIVFLSLRRTFKISSLSNFQVCSVVLLTTSTILNIKSPELIHLTSGSLYSLTTVFSFPPPTFTSFLMSKWGNNDKTKEHCHSTGVDS